MATGSSSRRFWARPAAATALTRKTYSPRCSCISSIVISAATVHSAETNLPARSACRRSGSIVRRPSVAAAIEPVHQIDDDRDDDDRDDEPEDQTSDQCARHHTLPSCFLLLSNLAPLRSLIDLNLRVCSVSATSTGSRSIEEAP